MYATADELQAYTGQVPPADAERLLLRASELIDDATVQRAALCTSDVDKAALRDATCAQVEFWLQTGESHAVTGATGRVQIGNLGYDAPRQLAPRAKAALSRRGLLYRGVGTA